MSFIINRVFPIYRETVSIENRIREFEIQCANKCQNLTPREFKCWLYEVEIELLKLFAERKCHYMTSRDLTVHEINQCINKITEYTYRIYRSNYFIVTENGHDEEDQSFEDEMVHLLHSIRNGITSNEAPTNEMLAAALENDMRSAMLFYNVMLSINSRREIIVPRRKFDIKLEEEKEEEKEIECFICLENISNITCIKQNCSHECCATCLIKTINADKRPKPLCAMCRTPIENLVVKTTNIKNELCEIFT
uniref:RING-type domain-containing protein n=1 Tax=viral metagenome TaxID=1070528 RepID=A0A6C0AQR4_9ZZZZ